VRKIVMAMSVSLDGYFEGPDGDLSWHLVDDELHAYFNEQLAAMSAFLDGRVTYQLMAGFWPNVEKDPASGPLERAFSRIWREIPKVVYSRTLQDAGWNTTIVREVVPQEVEALKAQPGGDMAIGGAELAAAFRRHDLIDEHWLYVMPVVLGGGRPLFPPGEARRPLALAETRRFGNGVVLLRYTRPG
jgi:dihydrofolate reductase